MAGLDDATIALGCMRLSTDPDGNEARAEATVRAAWEAGVRDFDTARAYSPQPGDEGHNERLLARVLPGNAFVVTKGGMVREATARGYRPDGRATRIRADAEASAEVFGRPPDLWLLHAPDPKVRMTTSLRALAAILQDGTATAVGLSNVHREQLVEALDIVPVAAVQVPLSPFDDEALRDGIVALCRTRGIPVLAHSPLGGVARAPRLARRHELTRIAAAAGLSAAQGALAWLRSLGVVPVVGARRPDTARELVFSLPASDALHAPRGLEPASPWAEPPQPPSLRDDGEVVVLMGIAGSGKSRRAQAFVDQGYMRFNRDERGGTLRGLAHALDEALSAGASRAVLDNTYLSRASRAEVVMTAWRHRLPVRCIHVDTPEGAAQVNLVSRMLDELGEIPGPEALRRSRAAGVLPPLRHHRMATELVPPHLDEGFSRIETIPFTRRSPGGTAGRVVPLDEATRDASLATLAIGWRPDESPLPPPGDGVEIAACRHPGGAPRCWCRPPLPGLVVAWCRRRGIDPTRLSFIGGGRSHRQLAEAFAASYEPAPSG